MPRQEDVGADFHCSLLKRVGKSLRPYLPFSIQIKKHGNKVLKNGVTFGGISKAGQWKEHEIDLLCQTDTPFLIGIVNTREQWIDVFSTIVRYFVLYNWDGRGKPREVALMPYQPLGEGHLGFGGHMLTDLPNVPGMPGRVLKLPIGQPVVRISIADSEKKDKCEEIKGLLEPYLRMDEANAVAKRIPLGYFQWPLIVRSGKPMNEGGVGLVTHPVNSPMVTQQLRALTRIIASLLKSCHMSGMKDPILRIEPMLSLLPINQEPEFIGNTIKEALSFARTP